MQVFSPALYERMLFYMAMEMQRHLPGWTKPQFASIMSYRFFGLHNV
jgi:hypothetical protein